MLILMSVCLMAQPASCREERLNFSYEEINAMACMVHSQEAIAAWREAHPTWRIDRWRCVSRDKLETPI